jgi:hypothetical protein
LATSALEAVEEKDLAKACLAGCLRKACLSIDVVFVKERVAGC